MKIIVGLGNPEKKYENNLHNMGFLAIDKVSDALGIDFSLKSNLKAYVAQTILNGEKVILVKPITYMNLSGESVRAVCDFYKIDLKDLLVIYDDLDIDIGAIRFKPNGQSGTHNGMRNIVLHLSSTDFARVRIGIKRENANIPLVDYVLSNIPADKKDLFNKAITMASECALDFIKGASPDKLMCDYNGKAKTIKN